MGRCVYGDCVGDRIEKFLKLVERIDEGFVDWLIAETDFFKAPASTKFHGAYEGGLFDHSCQVAISLRNLTDRLELEWERPESPLLVGLLHDACKFNTYFHSSMPDDKIGTYKYRNDDLFQGHGEKSLITLLPHIYLTPEEIACIRYHMGSFVDRTEWPYYTKACQKYPNVLYTHTADMIASQIMGI